jgi:hypothetical protein
VRRVLTLLVLLTSSFAAHAGPVWYALAWKGAPSTFGTIDPSTGVVAPIAITTATLGRDLAVSPTGQLYGIFGDGDESLYTIDRLTGSTTLIGAFGIGIQTLAFRSDGALFGASYTGVYSIDPGNAAATLLGPSGIGFNMDNLRFDASDNLYVMSAEANSRLFRLNQTSGAATLIGASGVDDISLGGFLNGAFLGTNFSGSQRLVSVDPTTGLAGEGPFTGGVTYVIALDPTTVPEPGTVVLFGVGLLGVCGVRVRDVLVTLNHKPIKLSGGKRIYRL